MKSIFVISRIGLNLNIADIVDITTRHLTQKLFVKNQKIRILNEIIVNLNIIQKITLKFKTFFFLKNLI